MKSNRHLFPVLIMSALWFSNSAILYGQKMKGYWQQAISYEMDIRLDVKTNQFQGHQVMKYTNNSPDVLDKLYFHLYFNTFQPGSVMDMRSLYLPDPDPRIEDRISHLREDEIGYQKIISLTQNGKPLEYFVNGTILEVSLARPVRPGQSTKLDMRYDAQVPIQIRRSGRDNAEGIRYSMSQWYPKLCEYDERGWHAHPYIGREYYGVWGDFDVRLTLDASYIVGAGGELQNANEVGHGYSSKSITGKSELTWHFKANKVHDFVWAADPDYVHDTHVCADGVVLHALYEKDISTAEYWKMLLPKMEEAIRYLNAHYGRYPYPVYSFIQGGDGGMEYPMATLITGKRSLGSLVGVSIHEVVHSWFQMVFGFNESYYYWMDEGFTNYVSEKVVEHLKSKKMLPGDPDPNPFLSFYKGYQNLVQGGLEEPLSTHADHFETNTSYSTAAYAKGAVYINQLEYVIGKDAMDKGWLMFYNQWKFKHPDANDFIRVMENVSGLELDWYNDYMINSTKFADYAIDTIYSVIDGSVVQLSRKGLMPMPIDIEFRLEDGSMKFYTVPLDIMRGAKNEFSPAGMHYEVMADWNWVNTKYFLQVPFFPEHIKSIVIDPTARLADLDSTNNQWPPQR